MTDVTPRMKPDNYGPCECAHERCGVDGIGRLGKPDRFERRHVRGCGCPSCLGRRNRSKGDRKATKARKALGIAGVNSRHEEVWGGSSRTEVKAGSQVKACATRFLKDEAQSEACRPVGDNRPFHATWMPDGWGGDGIIAFRLSQAAEVAAAILENVAGES